MPKPIVAWRPGKLLGFVGFENEIARVGVVTVGFCSRSSVLVESTMMQLCGLCLRPRLEDCAKTWVYVFGTRWIV